MILRLYFVLFTQGTYDVDIWRGHAERISEIGLINHYRENSVANDLPFINHYRESPPANHPPFMSEIGLLILQIARLSGIPFRVLFRLPFALIDGGTVILLLLILRQAPRRLLVAAAYWLNPLAILLSSFQGNTDCAVAFFVLLSVFLLSQNRNAAGAMALGAGLWIKIPVILALPALLLLVGGWRKKLEFLSLAGLTAVSTYLPALLIDPQAVCASVFGYSGLILRTTGDVPVWGWFRVLLPIVVPAGWRHNLPLFFAFLSIHGWHIAVGLILVLVWRRRAQRSPCDVCATIAGSYVLIYGLSQNWSFQYFAWSLPFWFFLPAWFPVLATILAGGYIYSLYACLCGDPWLRGRWDFMGHPQWPAIVIIFRDLAVLFFLACACWLIIDAMLPKPQTMGNYGNDLNPSSAV
jgi:hypothetical protein